MSDSMREKLAAITCERCRDGWKLVQGNNLHTGQPITWHTRTGFIQNFECTSKADEILALLAQAEPPTPPEPNFDRTIWIVQMSRTSGGKYNGWLAAEDKFHFSEVAAKEHMARLEKNSGCAWDYRVMAYATPAQKLPEPI